MALPPLAEPQQLANYTAGAITASDPRAKTLLEAASEAARRYCGWHIAPVITETLVLDGSGSDIIELPTMRVKTIDALTERLPGPAARVHEWTPDELTNLEWSRLGTLRRRHGIWTDRYQGITITLSHGYDTAPDVAQTVCQIAAMALASPTGATHEQAGGVSISYGTTASGVAGGLTLLDRDRLALDPYAIRRP
ncbi:hypothetical protein [Actinomyces ruminis]|uniref:Head-to-tail adaptor n=1 Tax=Actinomyces ruminis TaxID=1937003 RepID=A0ABX4MEZ3_9ACTO|nr:hypothetical protein [Actinomyces ruminis]PHP52590.1 hypothetical protein BW737_008905 [Actinomyces ruminis]